MGDSEAGNGVRWERRWRREEEGGGEWEEEEEEEGHEVERGEEPSMQGNVCSMEPRAGCSSGSSNRACRKISRCSGLV